MKTACPEHPDWELLPADRRDEHLHGLRLDTSDLVALDTVALIGAAGYMVSDVLHSAPKTLRDMAYRLALIQTRENVPLQYDGGREDVDARTRMLMLLHGAYAVGFLITRRHTRLERQTWLQDRVRGRRVEVHERWPEYDPPYTTSGETRTDDAGVEVVEYLWVHCAHRRVEDRRGHAELLVRHFARTVGTPLTDLAWKPPFTTPSASLVYKLAPGGFWAPAPAPSPSD